MKVSELNGLALNWAVCLAEGNKPVINPHRFGSISYGAFDSELGYAIKNYTTDWAQSGPIIEREKIGVVPSDEDANIWIGSVFEPDWKFNRTGPTPLIAAMRCYVASKLGDEIEIPKELV